MTRNKRRKRTQGAKTASGPPPADAYQVGPGVVVTVAYEVFDAEGEHVGGSSGDREILFGFGQLLPAVEQQLEGLWPGDAKSVKVEAKDAYGERDPTALVEFDRDEFPPDVVPGDTFEAEGAGGEIVVLRVLDVADDAVIVDQNHPLAGQAVRVEVEVRAARAAGPEELRAAEAALLEEAEEAQTPLIPAARLLRGPSQR